MKTSLQWLAEYIDRPLHAAEVAACLTKAGLEMESIERPATIPAGVVTAVIISRDRHPNADKLSVCRVDDGGPEPLQIVCGAPNCDAGKAVPLARLGTEFPNGLKIAKVKLRGVESSGMLCSAAELGLPGGGQAGLLELEPGTRPGQPLETVLRQDTVIDWEVTPNRPDWLSHIGIARELAAVLGCPEAVRLPRIKTSPSLGAAVSSLASVSVEAPDLCPRYQARVIRGIKIGPSPEWLQRTLRAVGQRPINNVVDITNFVMLECGQPLHAFDYDRLAGHAIIVRRARPGEVMTTLDGRQQQLDAEKLVIADRDAAVALAGVMGGASSEISDGTTTVLLESAAFLAKNIRATAKKLGMHTESSHRFERGVNLEMVDFAGARAAALICELAGGSLADGCLDAYAAPWKAAEVTCRVARVNQLLGTDLDAAAIASCFTRLGLPLAAQDAGRITVSAPAFRLDLEREVDLIEEVARIHGLDNIPAAAAAATLGGPMTADTYYPVERARAELLGLGLDEIMNYTLMAEAKACAGTGAAPADLVTLANPISAEACCLRPSLLPNLLQTVHHNLSRHNPDLAMFEIGRVFSKSQTFPEERLQAGILLTGSRHPERFGAEAAAKCDFFDLKGLVEGWCAARRLVEPQFSACNHPAFKPGTAAAVAVDGREIAVLGEVAAEFTADMRLQAPLFIALFELGPLFAATPAAPAAARALPQFPATARDISLVAPKALRNREILAAIRAVAPPLLESVALFDLYEDEKAVGAGKLSLAYSMVYRSPDRTLTDAEVNTAHEDIRRALAAKLPVQLR